MFLRRTPTNNFSIPKPFDWVCEARNICHTYQRPIAVPVLNNITLALKPGEVTALMGPSGSGKSTLLHILGLLEAPTSGDVIIAGHGCKGLTEEKRTQMRQRFVGFIYQFHHLIDELTALENIMLPQRIRGVLFENAKKTALNLLQTLHLEDRAFHHPSQLSGGEQQRVAVARALANAPLLILADEPTGNLDEKAAQDFLIVLKKMVKTSGSAALVATHNSYLGGQMDTQIVLGAAKVIRNK